MPGHPPPRHRQDARRRPPGRARPGRKLPPEPLDPDEVQRLLAACNRGTTGLRARALVVTLWRSGLRLGECLALRPKDLDLARGTLRVLHGKGDRDRVVGLDPAASELLARWLDRRRSLGIDGHAPVFCTLDGGPASQAWVRGLLRRLARKARIEKRVHAHGLRHTHATELAREGQSLAVIQAQLGHRSPVTTSRYLHRLAPEAMIEAIRGRPAWSDWQEPVTGPGGTIKRGSVY